MSSFNGPLNDVAARKINQLAVTRDYISQPRISKNVIQNNPLITICFLASTCNRQNFYLSYKSFVQKVGFFFFTSRTEVPKVFCTSVVIRSRMCSSITGPGRVLVVYYILSIPKFLQYICTGDLVQKLMNKLHQTIFQWTVVAKCLRDLGNNCQNSCTSVEYRDTLDFADYFFLHVYR